MPGTLYIVATPDRKSGGYYPARHTGFTAGGSHRRGGHAPFAAPFAIS